MATPVKFGTEFLVNGTTTLSAQTAPTITGLTNGKFVVAWTDSSATGGDVSGDAVRAQMFNADGTPFGGEILVNTATSGDQFEPTITALAGGGFAVAWADNVAVRAQVFDASGGKMGAEFVANITFTEGQPATTVLADGRFAVAFTIIPAAGDGSGLGIRARIFSPDGTPSANSFAVNTTPTNDQVDPTITALADGRFVVAWTDSSQIGGDGSGTAIRAQILNSDGTRFGDELLVNTTLAFDQADPTITALADGRFVVAWTDASGTGGDASGEAVRAQVFNANGSRSGAEILVNTTTTGFQNRPAITALVDGRFVVAWTDTSETGGDTSGFAVRAQVFNADGTPSGAEFLVNSTTPNDQFQPAITALADGRFVVAWTDESFTGGDVSSDAVRAQIFDPRERGIILSGTAQGDDFVGTGFADFIDGAGGNDFLAGGEGADAINGGVGFDIASWLNETSGLTLNLNNQTLNAGTAAGDSVSNVEAFYLTNFADNFTADGSFVFVYGFGGNDTITGSSASDYIDGGPGADTIDAAGGFDYVSYYSATSGVTLDLKTPANNTDDAAGDVITNAEVYILTAHDDTFVGADTGQNIVFGYEGNDTYIGGFNANNWFFDTAGDNRMVGGGVQDLFVGAGGVDTIVPVTPTPIAGSSVFNFTAGQDKIEISRAAFGLSASYAIADGSTLVSGTNPTAPTAQPTFFYYTDSGLLYFDQDGADAGAASLLMQLAGAPALSSADFNLTSPTLLMNFASAMGASQPMGDNLTPDAQDNSMQTNLATNPTNPPAA